MSNPRDPRPDNGHTSPWEPEEGTQPEIPVLDVNRQLCAELSEASAGLNAVALSVTGLQRDIRHMRTPAGPEIIRSIAQAFAAGRDHMAKTTERLEGLYEKVVGK